MSKFSMFLRSYPVLLIVLGLASSSVVSSVTIVYRPAISAPTADETFFQLRRMMGKLIKSPSMDPTVSTKLMLTVL